MRRHIPTHKYFLGDFDPMIRFLIIADIICFASVGLLGPIFAIFIIDFIQGGTEAVAGIAAAIFLLTKSLMQIPAAAIVDRICGEKDDFYFLFGSMLIVSLLPLLYLIIQTPLELYFVQFVLGLVTAFTFPSFMALFTRHTPPGKEGMTWGVYYTLTDLSSAATAAIGGFLAVTIGFEKVIYAVVMLSLIGTFLYLPAGASLQKHVC